MNWLDIVIIICIAIGIIHGLFTGIIKQVISLISLIAAVLLSGAIAKVIRHWVESHFQDENHWFSPNVQNAVFYVLAFLLIVCLFTLAAKLVDKILNHTPVGALNKLFGAVFGMALWAFCLSIALNCLAVFDSQYRIISKPVKENSICYEPVRMLFPMAFPYIQEFFKHEENVK